MGQKKADEVATPVCAIPECGRRQFGRSLCAGHYGRLRRGLTGERLIAPIAKRGRDVPQAVLDALTAAGKKPA